MHIIYKTCNLCCSVSMSLTHLRREAEGKSDATFRKLATPVAASCPHLGHLSVHVAAIPGARHRQDRDALGHQMPGEEKRRCSRPCREDHPQLLTTTTTTTKKRSQTNDGKNTIQGEIKLGGGDPEESNENVQKTEAYPTSYVPAGRITRSSSRRPPQTKSRRSPTTNEEKHARPSKIRRDGLRLRFTFHTHETLQKRLLRSRERLR